MMDWYDNGGIGAGGWIAMILMMSLFWGGVIAVGIILFRGARGGRDSSREAPPTHRRPVDILDERFARGEIEQDEYEARKAVLLGIKL
ncbi:SHOCT domain-containing protein [Nocardioides sp.]|uniref:SHOCT domain-containing protein n=1 Tax=metagenome TaxID=256318 RepID=A0A2P2BX34_9ZZZZ